MKIEQEFMKILEGNFINKPVFLHLFNKYGKKAPPITTEEEDIVERISRTPTQIKESSDNTSSLYDSSTVSKESEDFLDQEVSIENDNDLESLHSEKIDEENPEVFNDSENKNELIKSTQEEEIAKIEPHLSEINEFMSESCLVKESFLPYEIESKDGIQVKNSNLEHFESINPNVTTNSEKTTDENSQLFEPKNIYMSSNGKIEIVSTEEELL